MWWRAGVRRAGLSRSGPLVAKGAALSPSSLSFLSNRTTSAHTSHPMGTRLQNPDRPPPTTGLQGVGEEQVRDVRAWRERRTAWGAALPIFPRGGKKKERCSLSFLGSPRRAGPGLPAFRASKRSIHRPCAWLDSLVTHPYQFWGVGWATSGAREGGKGRQAPMLHNGAGLAHRHPPQHVRPAPRRRPPLQGRGRVQRSSLVGVNRGAMARPAPPGLSNQIREPHALGRA
jgi:hypothetical protein